MHAWHDVPWGEDLREYFHAVIEIPEGSKVKYELHKPTGLLVADRVLYSAVHYPANYGFIPQTYCLDGDPLDVLVLSQVPLVPLSLARSRAIGAMTMSDERGEDDKVIAVHIDDPQFAHYRDIAELPPHVMEEVERFFLDYKVLERKEVRVGRMVGHAGAERVVQKALELYAEKRSELVGAGAAGRAHAG
jgi:inorganic pyrophosphatase